LLSARVASEGMKVVVTGEGADEFLGGYDIFREARLRRFWARQPMSTQRPRLFERLYPWLARSTNATGGMATSFWGRGLEHHRTPSFSHEPRWNTARSLQRYLSASTLEHVRSEPDPVEKLLASLPVDFTKYDPLCQAQYLEMVTLLSAYILSSQGDRVLMANSVEGRFPFLDAHVMEFSNQLPASEKLFVLNEKYCLKQAARGLVPKEILNRSKQPYRAPDAACFVAEDAPDYVRELLSERRINDAGLFDAEMVEGLYNRCARKVREGKSATMSNADNMALVGVLTTQIAHERFVRKGAEPQSRKAPGFSTVIELCELVSGLGHAK
jgi:asparagine synthase (glutamine-hydrolysing)